MKSLLDKDFKYTPVAEQKRNYLHDKFDAIRAEQEAKTERGPTVTQIKRRAPCSQK